MRKTITFVAILILVAVAGFLALFKRDLIVSLFKKTYAEARGYEPARSPQQAIDLFKKAMKERDYEIAAEYCTADYAEQLRKGATEARELAKKIDDLRVALEKRGLASNTTTDALLLLEPFPHDFELVDLKYKDGDEKATALLKENVDADINRVTHIAEWQFVKQDPDVCKAFTRSLRGNPCLVNLKRQGTGDAQVWKLDIPVNGQLRRSVDQLKKKYKDYVNALDVMDHEIKVEATAKVDVERRLKEELDKAGPTCLRTGPIQAIVLPNGIRLHVASEGPARS
jgi:hypothetical protein